jgi:hypothetical protein
MFSISDKDERKYEDVDNLYENDDSETVSIQSFKYDDDNNTIKASISSNLSELLGIPKNTIETANYDWNPPEKNGLNNCNTIIPSYYIKSYDRVIDIDYYTIIKDDIKNYRPLNNFQLDYITKICTNEEKNYIISLFNNVLNNFADFLF